MPETPPIHLVPRLTVLVSPDAERVGASVPLGAGRLMVGRSPDLGDLPLADARLSRAHFDLRWCADGTLRIRDRGSRHGTSVGGGRIDAPLFIRSDATIRAGDSVFHVGMVLEAPPGSDPTDTLIRVLADRLAAAGEGLFTLCAPPGVGLRRLARRVHRLRRSAGTLIIADHTAPPARFGDTVLALPRCVPPAPGPGVLVLSAGHRARDASVLIPPLDTRRLEVWRNTVAHLEALGAPGMSPGAAEAWLNAGFPDGWRTVQARLATLSDAWPGEGLIQTPQVADALNRRLQAAPDVLRSMARPDASTLSRELARLGSVADLARHYGRSRRQIYRWLQRYGLQR